MKCVPPPDQLQSSSSNYFQLQITKSKSQISYKASLLHLQPRQMRLIVTELRDDMLLQVQSSFSLSNLQLRNLQICNPLSLPQSCNCKVCKFLILFLFIKFAFARFQISNSLSLPQICICKICKFPIIFYFLKFAIAKICKFPIILLSIINFKNRS